MHKFAIIGYPIKQTLSPIMHNAGFELYGLSCRYEAIEIPPDRLLETLPKLVDDGFSGFNVTIPFKEKVQPLLTTLSPEAQASGAVNMIHVHKEGWFGHNTDIMGVLKTLEPYKAQINQNEVLVIGAGGTARAMLYVLTRHFAPARICVAGRSIHKTKALLSNFKLDSQIRLCSIDFNPHELNESIRTSIIIINTTPIGMLPKTDDSPLPPDAPLRKEHLLFDAIYRPLQTKFLKEGLLAGATAIDGLTMFIHQGAETFKIWTGQDMPIDKIRQILMEHLQ
ncbi:MAG: shikimate dehydrogenase [Bacteroidota bacterium]